jgi:hypothetical protein
VTGFDVDGTPLAPPSQGIKEEVLMYRCHQARFAACSTLLFAAFCASASALAADAHQAVNAKPGDIVLLRNVSMRPAYRPAPPGMALMVDPSPQHELRRALGTEELSDADYANLEATPAQRMHGGTVVERVIGSALGNSLGNSGGRANVAGNGVSNVVSGPLGAVGNTTRGIGDQVRGALSQLPGMTPPAGR